MGKICLRGGEEHRNLKISQFKKNENGYVYTENSSKNRSGGMAQMQVSNKTVPIYPISEVADRCHVTCIFVNYRRKHL